MSRAFVKEVEPEIDGLPDRPVSVHPNFVTAEGLAAIERTLSRFEAANKAAVAKNDRTAIAATQRELRYWTARRSSAQVVEPAADKSRAQFGATVTVQRDDGRAQRFRIVGEDEAEPARVAYPMSLRLLVRYLAERSAIPSRSPVGTQLLRQSNNRRTRLSIGASHHGSPNSSSATTSPLAPFTQ
jgi:transcription elongation GreA/GreB family factor